MLTREQLQKVYEEAIAEACDIWSANSVTEIGNYGPAELVCEMGYDTKYGNELMVNVGLDYSFNNNGAKEAKWYYADTIDLLPNRFVENDVFDYDYEKKEYYKLTDEYLDEIEEEHTEDASQDSKKRAEMRRELLCKMSSEYAETYPLHFVDFDNVWEWYNEAANE